MTDKEILDSLERASVPKHLRGGIVRYIISGIKPGSFLCAVIANDLISVLCRASDDLSLEDLRAVCRWLHNDAPDRCHGTYVLMADWIIAKAKEYGIHNQEAITK